MLLETNYVQAYHLFQSGHMCARFSLELNLKEVPLDCKLCPFFWIYIGTKASSYLFRL